MKLYVASGSGNRFAYAFAHEGFQRKDGPRCARILKDHPARLDGFFLLDPYVPGQPWRMTHWDTDGAETFCSNGTRAALALLEHAPLEQLSCYSNQETVGLKKTVEGIGLHFPEDDRMGLFPVSLSLPQRYRFGFIGNPQLVVLMDTIHHFDLHSWAPRLRYHQAFPGGTNVNIVELMGPGEARIRSYERGVERETACCGTGCAVAGAWLTEMTTCTSWKFHTKEDPVHITLSSLEAGRWKNLWLSGPIRVQEPISIELD
jgi:diaminopimelate epimerase